MTTTPTKFKCPECSKEFSSRAALGPHRRIAHGYRVVKKAKAPYPGSAQAKLAGKFPCPHCDFVAVWKGGLTHHMNARHPEGAAPTLQKPEDAVGTFQCSECSRVFQSKGALGIHRRQTHGIVGASRTAQLRQRSEVAKGNQNAITISTTNGHVQAPTHPEDDGTTHRLEAAATYAAGRVAQLLEGIALQLEVSFKPFTALVLRTVGETTKIR